VEALLGVTASQHLYDDDGADDMTMTVCSGDVGGVTNCLNITSQAAVTGRRLTALPSRSALPVAL